ncbi:MAG: TRAP transporter small permease [Nitratireductor sp.]|nr:TRAP transporter small permease [Nitratireductor sp.]
MFKRFDSIVNVLALAGLFVSGLMVLAMTGLICLEVVLRSFFNHSLLVVDEVVGYMLATFAFFGISYAMRSGALLRIDTFLIKLPARYQSILQLVFDLASLAFAGVLEYHLLTAVERTFSRGVVSVSITNLPVWIPQAVMPIGLFVLILVILVEIARSARAIAGIPAQDGN